MINVPRLALRLRASKYTAQGSTKNSFIVSVAQRPELDKCYLSLVKSPHVEVDDTLLPSGIVQGTRPFLEKMAHQINGCCQFGFYDACAVVCRRMVESLLIQAFDKAGQLAAIQDANGNLLGLDQVLAKAKSRQFIKLGRTTVSNIEKIKEVGDTAAHDRYHITSEQDIAEFRTGFRKAISELLVLAGISPKPAAAK